MTTDELNAIVKAVMDELEKAGVDFDFKAETPQADDLVYVMRGTADKYQGITVKWQNLLDIIVKKATDAKDEAVSAKDIALQTLATIQGIESNISTMKSSIDASEANVASMKASIETSESNVTQMKSEVSEMKTSVEGTKTEVENIKEETAGLLDTKVNYTDSLTYEEIMATNADLTNKVASASALKTVDDKLQRAITFYVNPEVTTLTYTLKTNVNYILINADDSLGVWILAQTGFGRIKGTIFDGGWSGASFSISGNTLTITQTAGGTYYYLIPLNTI